MVGPADCHIFCCGSSPYDQAPINYPSEAVPSASASEVHGDLARRCMHEKSDERAA